jgi:multicomponent Na+:H+ antiporter subunit G
MLVQIVSYTFLFLGGFFIFTGAIGAIRMPDFYTRVHSLGVSDVCGVPIFLFGLICKIGINYHSIKLLLLIIFIFLTSPIATHILVRTAYRKGLKPVGIIEDSTKIQSEQETLDAE